MAFPVAKVGGQGGLTPSVGAFSECLIPVVRTWTFGHKRLKFNAQAEVGGVSCFSLEFASEELLVEEVWGYVVGNCEHDRLEG